MPDLKKGRKENPVLDPTISENIGSIKDLWKTYREWGFEMVKHDYTTYDIFGKWGSQMHDEMTTPGWQFNDNTKTNAEITRLTKAFIEKKELLTTLDQLKKRAENLKTMSNLFKGAGFVQYVSSIYLKQLCENANVRFRKMTRNQLSLQVNDANDFEVIDYLNEGRTRSVKTLSGGQSFQVSLSLALALAESVQTNSVASKNFFFIDEGFGTQDAESVNIVFETLNNLHKENRIVGIISHVEELKERIPVALQITKTDEAGSLIKVV
jgi:exonuclease SbcC